MQVSWRGAWGIPKGKEATTPSNIKVIQIVQGGKEMPPDGGIVLPEDVQMKPLISKSFFDPSLSVRVFVGAMSSNSFLGGHADLDGGHPGQVEYSLERVLVAKVPSAPFGPEIV
jgi:hypothetical protein